MQSIRKAEYAASSTISLITVVPIQLRNKKTFKHFVANDATKANFICQLIK